MKVGRPSKEIEKRITIGVDKETYEKLVYLANKERVSLSEYVRKVLRKNV